MAKIKVLINKKNAEGCDTGDRITVEADFLKDNATNILVKLPDGNIVTRKKKRDIIM
jgi:hypothetical protein